MYNSNMVLYFVDNYVRNGGKPPKNMVEENIRVDYNKLRMLIRKDKEFAHDASVIQKPVEQGFVTGELKAGFPAEKITHPDNFISLLFHFNMLTIDGTFKGATKLTIPDQVVREQLYNCLHRYSSQRDKQKGEAYVHGFTLAMTSQNRFYHPVSEQDTQAGYADIFLLPLTEIYKDMKHSYIIELKYAKEKDSNSRVEQLRQEAITQAHHYAASENVQRNIGNTRLHRIVVIYRGMEMAVCEEIEEAN